MTPGRSFVRFAVLCLSTLTFLFPTSTRSQSQKPLPLYDTTKHKFNVEVLPRGAIKPNVTGPDGSSCTLIDFEGLADLAAIPDFQGISLPDWLSLIEQAAGGNGNFSNEPSPVTIAFWLNGNPTSQTINIPNGATTISLYYTTAYPITLTAYDSGGKVVATSSGSANYPGSGKYNVWTPLSVSAPSGKTIASLAVSGYANYTGIDNLNVCQSPTIASIEVTQAIQQYQTLDDLKASLSANGEPPVPIISGKQSVLRTYLNPVQDVTNVTINISGVVTDSKRLALQPNCTPDKQRAQSNGCSSIDFYFSPPSGSWTATLDVLDPSGNTVEEEILPITSRDTNSLRLRSVSVCHAKDSSGKWLCGDITTLNTGAISLLSKIAPTKSVFVEPTTYEVDEDIADFPAPNDPKHPSGYDVLAWETAARNKVGWDWLFDGAGIGDIGQNRRTTYFGVVQPAPKPPAPDLLLPFGGIAQIGWYWAIGRTDSPWTTSVNIGPFIVAHETGHTLDLLHTNTKVPVSTAPGFGCWDLASQPGTDWPFANNYIQDTTRPEVGFDVSAQKPLDPMKNFELMGYCSPNWISPQRYKTMIGTLGGGSGFAPSVEPRQNQPATAPTPEPFWTVSGTLTESGVTFEPLFELTAQGNTGIGTGTYSLEVRDAAGKALFTRQFTPTASVTENALGSSSTDETAAPDSFNELIPVTANAATIVLLSPQGAELGRITFGGIAPSVSVTLPTAGSVESGLQNVSWIVKGTSVYWSKVLYSSNNGATWSLLSDVQNESTIPVNFDLLAGSKQALIRVLVSDGVNTGTATSSLFSVSRKKPRVIHIDTPAPNFAQAAADPVYLSGSVYDPDDGVLTGSALQWSSNLQGSLGSGSPLSVKLKPGNHILTLTGTDSDGNKISATTNVTIGGAPPVVNIQVKPLDTVPTTCEYATVSATPGVEGASLSLVQYSVDGGNTYTTVPLTALPYGFVVPGSGFLHLVARAYDISGQSNAQDVSFLTQSACTLMPQTITFASIGNQTYGVAPLVLNATASSGLSVSFAVTGPATISGATLTITGAGTVTVTASQSGNNTFAPANLASQTFTVAPASLKVTANNASRPVGAPNPTLTYTITGFVNKDTASVVSGAAILITAATTSSPAGKYPIAFSAEALTASNYTFAYIPGTLTVTSTAKVGTTTTMSSSPSSNLTPGEDLTLTVTVTADSGTVIPTGTITFGSPETKATVNAALGANGILVYHTKVPKAGTYSVYATYSGSSVFAGSISPTLTGVVK